MHSSDDRGGRSTSKTRQLCAQVHDALSFALGDSLDPILTDLVLESVEPLEGDRQVLVAFSDPCGHGLAASLDALDRARGWLRDAVAAAITRRRVPALSFTVLPAGGAR